MDDSTDQSGQQHKRQMQLHHQYQYQYPSLGIGSTNCHQDMDIVVHQQQQQQNFMLSVLLLQQNLHNKQQQQQQQQQQALRKIQPFNGGDRLPLDVVSSQLPPVQAPIPPIHNINPNPQRSTFIQHRPELQQQQHHQYQTGSSTEAVASLANEAEEPRKQELARLRVVTTKLERKSLERPWGLGFVSIQNSINIPNKHTTNTIASLLSGIRVIMVKPPPSPAEYLARLLPGDIILAIDGKPVSSWSANGNANGNSDVNSHNTNHDQNKNLPNDTTTTAKIASYLRSILTVSIVVLRHPEIAKASAILTSTTAATKTTRRDPYTISSAANRAWNQLLVPSVAPKPTPGLGTTPNSKKTATDDALVVYRNPWFWQNDEHGNKVHIPYDDNKGSSIDYELYRQQDGSRAGLFLPPIPSTTKTDFGGWMSERKATWRSRYKVYKLADKNKKPKKKKPETKITSREREEKNDLENHASNDCELYRQEDESRADTFLSPIPSTEPEFCGWLSERKISWRSRYKVYKFADTTKKPKKKAHDETKPISRDKEEMMTDSEGHASNTDFWTSQGFSSFDEWLRNRSIRWHRSYSWNKRKRQKIEEECFEKVVFLPSTNHAKLISATNSCSTEEFHEWLKARRVQWRMFRRRRKRQRLSLEGTYRTPERDTGHCGHDGVPAAFGSNLESPRCVADLTKNEDGKNTQNKPTHCKRKLQFLSEEDQQMAFIDEILEEKEKETKELLRKRAERPPIDIARFFDATKGIPDDVVAHCFAYLDASEHGKLLVIDKTVSKSLKDRHGVWQMLCPSHWILPRRPRKPWHELYLTRLRKERDLHQKRWDDLLVKCSSALFKRDDLQKVEKLVEKAQSDFGFDLNYSSGVVCERNSILNLAVIHGRYKVVRWLVDTKHAEIETSDRGNFTPLLNAAWSGDRWLVRFFLQRKSNRNAKGTQHYTQGIAPPGFEGKTAEKWAEQRGHAEVAKLIRLGL